MTEINPSNNSMCSNETNRVYLTEVVLIMTFKFSMINSRRIGTLYRAVAPSGQVWILISFLRLHASRSFCLLWSIIRLADYYNGLLYSEKKFHE